VFELEMGDGESDESESVVFFRVQVLRAEIPARIRESTGESEASC
jgi:hypothetical protein